jgi:two-component system KDP operon response regulator KdpE
MAELLARLKAALRHGLQAVGEAPIFRAGSLAVDLVNRRVMIGESEIHLSPKEYSLLRFLVAHAGKVVTHQQLLKEVWGPAHVEDVQYLRVLMRQLRQKIEPNNAEARLLVTEPGVGYRLLVPSHET